MSVVDPLVAALVDETEILLVEDDPGDAVLVQACLYEVGVPDEAIIWVRTLGDALAVLGGSGAGCVLLDLGLPDAAGFDAVHAVVEAAPTTAVIVLTGRQERDGVDALGAGAQDFLSKDALTGELLERSVRYAVERKRAAQARQLLLDARMSAAEQARLERGLLPRPLVRSAATTCATYYRPGRDHAVLGGDFFDVVETADGRVHALVGDVMGHGPDEAALGVHLRVAWRTLLLSGAPSARIFPTLALLLGAEEASPHFVTACEITIADGGLSVRLAGHPAPVIVVDGVPRYLDAEVGPPIGVRGMRAEWPVTETRLPAGSSVLLYTDGLLDAYAPHSRDSELGIPQLVDAVRAHTSNGEPAGAWVSALVAAAPFESADDTAVVVLTTA